MRDLRCGSSRAKFFIREPVRPGWARHGAESQRQRREEEKIRVPNKPTPSRVKPIRFFFTVYLVTFKMSDAKENGYWTETPESELEGEEGDEFIMSVG